MRLRSFFAFLLFECSTRLRSTHPRFIPFSTSFSSRTIAPIDRYRARHLDRVMTAYMAQPRLNLPPASRQDIISALLNDYGNSFQGGDSSPYQYSPVSSPKDLPPTPPAKEGKYSHDKPLPPVGRMSMRFQLRGNKFTLISSCVVGVVGVVCASCRRGT